MYHRAVNSFKTVEISVEGGIGHLRLARQERFNAMNPQFFVELAQSAQALSDTAGIRAIVISAKGPHFSVGLDLKESVIEPGAGSHAAQSQRTYRDVKKLQNNISVLARLPQPTIAAIQGYCIGAGVDLIAACDIRVASSDAIFSIRESKLAIVADLGSLQRLPRIISRGHLMELALTAQDFDARRAEQIHLVNHVEETPAGALNKAIEIATRISENSPLSTFGTKEIVAAIYDAELDIELDRVALWNSAFLQSNDLAEALSAFLDKRKPDFAGS